jgi:hypothetical protein
MPRAGKVRGSVLRAQDHDGLRSRFEETLEYATPVKLVFNAPLIFATPDRDRANRRHR